MALTFHELQNETIAAAATGMTESGIGIIRISGPKAIAVGSRLFRNKKLLPALDSYKPGSIHFGYIVDPASEEIIDEVMVSVMLQPHSYTTEDTVEINSHGGIYLMNRILELVLENGARMAEPGEFTKRAFLGGRIDLSKAEAVMDLISSNNEFARKTSVAQLKGSVSDKVRNIRERILYEIAFIESALDDPENYSLDGYPQTLLKKCGELYSELKRMIVYSENGRILKEGIRTVIVGKPNAGKSSLLNYLSGQERAIVTDIPGTTRDTLEESVRLGDLVLHITDTAGIRDTEDAVEKIGVERAIKAADNADLIIMMTDTSIAVDEEDRKIAALVREKIEEGVKCIVLMNKSDLAPVCDEEQVGNLFPGLQTDIIAVSLTTGEGMEIFTDRIAEMFHTGEITADNEIFLSNLRQRKEAQNAAESVRLVMDSIQNGMSEDFFSIDLMNAYTSLGRILGEAVEDDLVEEIFSEFCLGK